MLSSIRVALPSRFGLDLSDPDTADQYWGSAEKSIQSAFDQIAREANDPRRITVAGKSLDAERDDGFFQGCLVSYDGTLSEARRQAAKRKMAVCDGYNGAPDLRHKFVRGAGENENAGGTGGATTGTPSVTVCDHAAVAAHTHAMGNHTHGATGLTVTVDANTDCVAVCTGGTAVANWDHAHTGAVGGNTAGPSTNTTGDGGAIAALVHTVSVGGISILPTHYEAIFLRRMYA